MSWKTTCIDHEARLRLGLSMNEYVCLDYIYRTQTSPKYGGKNGGWCETPLSKIGDFLGLSKGALSDIFKRAEGCKLLELDGNKRKTTELFWEHYESKSVQKVNDDSVRKVNAIRSETERDTLVYKENFKIKQNQPENITKSVLEKPQLDRKELTQKVKNILSKPYMLQTCRDYGSRDRLRVDVVLHMVDENFVYENDAMLASYVRGFVQRKSKERNEPQISEQTLKQVEEYLNVLRQKPYCQTIKPVRDFEIKKIANAIDSGLGIYDWRVLVDKLCNGSVSSEFCTVSYGVGKFWEENMQEIKATAKMIQRR